MFREAELGQKISKSEFNTKAHILRHDLIEVQQQLLELKAFPVIIVFAGVNGAGKVETVNLLNEWMDPRWLMARAYDKPSLEEQERPEFWRFWRDLPPKGNIGLFLSSWYSRPLLDRVHGRVNEFEFNDLLDRVVNFEKALTDDGALILKFWMHLGKSAQRKRFKLLEKNPLTSWRVTKEDWDNWRMYDQFEDAAERIITRSSTGDAPWSIVEGSDPNFRTLTVTTIIRDEINKKLVALKKQQQAASLAKSSAPVSAKVTAPKKTASAAEQADQTGDGLQQTELKQSSVLNALDMTSQMSKKEYKKQLPVFQARLNELHRKALSKKISIILLFEGPEISGNGGAIRRVVAGLDTRHCRVIPVAAPTDEERANHYLWRFWRHLSRVGNALIFDRSWYGRVLVERVDGLAKKSEWGRAYAEINDFEQQLADSGIVLMKYWIHISEQEQLDRFNARKDVPNKQWKLTDEEWRSRVKREDYEYAVNDMVEHTSTCVAPWTLIEGDDRRFARIKVIESLCNSLEKALKHNVKSWNHRQKSSIVKTNIIRLPGADKTPFLRGILVRSLVHIGLNFDDAYELAGSIREELRDVNELSSVDLQKKVSAELEKRFGKKPRQNYEARHQPTSDIIVHTRTRSMTFSTNILSQSLEACAINPKQALVSAGQVQAAISSTGIKEIDYKSLRKLIYQCLRDHYSDDAANRYLAWRQFYDSGRPMIVLIGGTTSTGKSIVAAELAYRLDIARTQSTDMMREIIRSYLAPHVAPTLQYSSYEAWRGLSTTNSGDTNRIVTGFLSQLATMKPAIQTTIASAIREKEHLILEGVHVLPTEIDIEQAENKAVVLPFMLAVLDKGVLRKRLTKRLRDASDQLGVERQESIDAIWKQQSWLLDVADVESIPILPNTEIEDTICDILELVSAEIVRRFPPDPAHLERDQ